MRSIIDKIQEAKIGDYERPLQDLIDAVTLAHRKISVAESAAKIVSRKMREHGRLVGEILVLIKDADIAMGKARMFLDDVLEGDTK